MNPISVTVEILKDAFPGVRVSTEVPMERDRPDRLVSVALEGMESDGLIGRARIGVTCWGRSDRDAFGMAIAAADALRDAALDHPYLSAAQLETLARDEWTANGQGRYYAAMALTLNTDETE